MLFILQEHKYRKTIKTLIMSFDFDHRIQLREEGETPSAVPSVPGGAYPQCNISAPYQTPFNTIGIGNPVMGGSDRFGRSYNFKTKKKKKEKFLNGNYKER